MTEVTFVPQRWDESEADEPGYWGVKRDWHEDVFANMIEAIGGDAYGFIQEETNKLNDYEVKYDTNDPMKHYCIDTPLFTLRPFYWGDNSDVYALPNFVYKPFDLEIKWYKWPMRDAIANCQISDQDWQFMCDNIIDYCKKLNQGQIPLVPQHASKLTDADLIAIKLRKQMRENMNKHDKEYEIIYKFFEHINSMNRGDTPTIYEIFNELKELIGWDEKFDGRLNITSFSQAADINKNAVAQITFDISPIGDNGDD